MPSKKNALARGVNANAKAKAKATRTGATPVSPNQVKMQLQQLPAKADKHQDPHLRSHSRLSSTSTDDGSSSSSCISSDALTNSSQASGSPSNKQRTSSDLSVHVCAPNKPLWMDNGLKGEKAAWLLVLPKTNSSVTETSMPMLKSPKDAVLLGPYVATKNTFLDESPMTMAMKSHRQQRSKSWDASSLLNLNWSLY